MKKEELEKKYLLENKTTRQIAEDYKVTKTAILYWLKKYNIPRRNEGRKAIDFSNQKIGNLQILYRVPSKSHDVKWQCICDCGYSFTVGSGALIDKQSSCYLCRNIRLAEIKKTGYEEISIAYFNNIKRSAKNRNIDFDLKIQDLWALYLKQEKKCALSNLPINFRKRSKDTINNTASLDRVNSKNGYNINNVQWIHKDINRMKNSYSQEYFINICKLIAENISPQ